VPSMEVLAACAGVVHARVRGVCTAADATLIGVTPACAHRVHDASVHYI
jgi:hypothetical protein